ncbi:MAG TPA: hypothetical protein DCM73_10610 [Clostridiales bacterium]|nr:hypothetical protein [Clostridiales bacterium]
MKTVNTQRQGMTFCLQKKKIPLIRRLIPFLLNYLKKFSRFRRHINGIVISTAIVIQTTDKILVCGLNDNFFLFSNKACNILIKYSEGVGEMNKITKKRINIRRKDQLNRKLALQVIFSIVLVAAVIVTKQLDSDLSRRFLNTADEKMSESIEPKEAGNSIRGFMSGVKDKVLSLSGNKAEYAAPVNGKIYQDYGLNKSGDTSFYNHGLDIKSNTQSVRSISDGKVTQVGNNEKLSNYVVVEKDGKTIIYGKINEALVGEGDKISKGDIIGALNEENMLLHIEVWEDGESVNPSKLFDMNE